MHEYLATSVDRTTIIARLAILATALFLGLGWVLHAAGVHPPFWLSPPGVLAFFAIVFRLYDRVLWRRKVFGWRLSTIPDVNGYWEGFITIEEGERRPEEERAERIPCRVQFHQTWSRMRHTFETPFTRAESSSATIVGAEQARSGLHYEYETRPKADSEEPGMGVHSGTARLEPASHGDWSHLVGDFFNDRHYRRYGQYDIHRLAEEPADAPWDRSR
jgi:predicted pore-forming effector associated with SMODS systems